MMWLTHVWIIIKENTENYFLIRKKGVCSYTHLGSDPQIHCHGVVLDKKQSSPSSSFNVYVSKVWNNSFLELIWQKLGNAFMFILLCGFTSMEMVGAGPLVHKHSLLSQPRKCPLPALQKTSPPPLHWSAHRGRGGTCAVVCAWANVTSIGHRIWVWATLICSSPEVIFTLHTVCSSCVITCSVLMLTHFYLYGKGRSEFLPGFQVPRMNK